MRRWASPGSSTCWRRACIATATTGARATAPLPLSSRCCRCVQGLGLLEVKQPGHYRTHGGPRIGPGPVLKSLNFGLSPQVGEHDLHFVSKVRRCSAGAALSPTPLPPFAFIPSALYHQIQLFSSPGFLGHHISFEEDQTSLPASFQPQSCRVHGGR